MAKKTKLPASIRIKLDGNHTTRNLRIMLNEAVDQLELKGIKNVRGCNLYVTPVYDDGDKQDPGRITIPHPYKSAADEHGV